MAATTPNAPATTRRRFTFSIVAAFTLGAGAGAGSAIYWAYNNRTLERLLKARRGAAHVELVNRVAPPDGYRTRVSFGDSIMRLVAGGAIAPEKFRQLYTKRRGLPEWIERLFAEPSEEPIKLGFDTAPYLLNLLWPLGLSTKTGFNSTSPLKGRNLPRFASTGGWRLGEAATGSVYFNQLETIRLDDVQENAVLRVAGTVFRPCCDNSTFFQDCNHGSALLGLLELAASQGATADELYELALYANVFWYPAKYVQTGIYFEQIENKPWHAVAPKTILGKPFSSLSGWNRNVRGALGKADLLPRKISRGAAGCGV